LLFVAKLLSAEGEASPPETNFVLSTVFLAAPKRLVSVPPNFAAMKSTIRPTTMAISTYSIIP